MPFEIDLLAFLNVSFQNKKEKAEYASLVNIVAGVCKRFMAKIG